MGTVLFHSDELTTWLGALRSAAQAMDELREHLLRAGAAPGLSPLGGDLTARATTEAGRLKSQHDDLLAVSNRINQVVAEFESRMKDPPPSLGPRPSFPNGGPGGDKVLHDLQHFLDQRAARQAQQAVGGPR